MMAVTAHPDDEAGNFGGILRLYAERGVETSVICLTPGQAASHRGPARNDAELSAIRREEFAASCRMLRVKHGMVLDYPDGQLHRIDLYKVVCVLTRHVRELRPHVVVAFGPEGGVTGHTDHSMAGIFITLAVQWAARNNRFPEQLDGKLTPYQVQKLYYTTADKGLDDRPPVTLAPSTAVIDVEDYVQNQIAAFRCHITQQPLWEYFERNVKTRDGTEKFHLVASARTGPATQETDLFAGVTAD